MIALAGLTSDSYLTCPDCRWCMQAGETIGQADSQDGSQGYDTWSNERLSQWLVAVVEAPSGGTGAARGTVELGVVAVETSTGAVQHSQFRQALCLSPTCKANSILAARCYVHEQAGAQAILWQLYHCLTSDTVGHTSVAQQ